MQLTQKNATAALDEIKSLAVKLSWDIAADLDLAVLYETATDHGFLYFNNKGDLNTLPFIKLGSDAGVGDRKDSAVMSETARLAKLDPTIKAVHFLVWDYGSIMKGIPSRFKAGKVELSITDQSGTTNSSVLDIAQEANVAVVASLVVGPTGANLVNTSKATLLKEFNDSKQFWDIVKQA